MFIIGQLKFEINAIQVVNIYSTLLTYMYIKKMFNIFEC